MKTWFLALMFPLLSSLLCAAPDPAICIVNDEDEYVVLAAVLFPNTPEIPKGMTNDLEQKAYIASKVVHLDGFHGNAYSIQETSMAAKTSPKLDPEFMADFSRKNSQSCTFARDKFLAYIPEGKSVNFISAEKIRQQRTSSSPKSGGIEEMGDGVLLGSEITRLSRPGFNKSRTAAVVELDLQAGPEMGVGYRAYLEKSPKTGKWILTGAERTRMY